MQLIKNCNHLNCLSYIINKIKMRVKNIFNTLKNNSAFILSSATVVFIWHRFNINFKSYEKAIKQEKIFDSRKANEQLKVYREIYDPNNDVEENNRLLNAASKEDKEKIKKIFEKYDDLDIDELEKQIEKLKSDIDYLKESKNTHQGVNLAKIYYGYQPSEDAMKKIRKNYTENKKKIDGEA